MDKNFAERRRRELMIAASLAVVAALVPLFVERRLCPEHHGADPDGMRPLSQSWNILSGYCGQISLGHALYFGLGAYTTAAAVHQLAAALVRHARGWRHLGPDRDGLGYPCFRLRGH